MFVQAVENTPVDSCIIAEHILVRLEGQWHFLFVAQRYIVNAAVIARTVLAVISALHVLV